MAVLHTLIAGPTANPVSSVRHPYCAEHTNPGSHFKGFCGINYLLRSLLIPRSHPVCPDITRHSKGDELTRAVVYTISFSGSHDHEFQI